MSFYITLPSNASMKMFPNNLIGNYTTKLHNPVELEGEWEVGLAEIMYPATWLNSKPFKLSIKLVNNISYEYIEKTMPNETINNIVNKMNLFFRKSGIPINAENDNERGIFHLRFNANVVDTLSMDEDLAKLLGFSSNNYKLLSQSRGIYSDMQQQFESLGAFLIYTDIIKHQYLGDAYVKVLRVIAPDNEQGKKINYITKVFDLPHYVSLDTSVLDTININLMNLYGEQIIFESGKIVVKLHFRKKYF